MIKIGICGINQQRVKETELIIDKILFEMKLDCDFKVDILTTHPEELVDHAKNNNQYGVYILNVQDNKGQLKGIRSAINIRKIDYQSSIIFISSRSELILEILHSHIYPLDFIVRGLDDIELRMKKSLLKCKEIYNNYINSNVRDVFYVNTRNKKIKVLCNNILYFESIGYKHKIKLRLENDEYLFYGTLKNSLSELPEEFVRCHKSFIVNKRKIKEIDKKNRIIIFDDKNSCLFSKNHYYKLEE
ncbi:accessory protein regulator A [Gottschalkia purinilytica]|uniref:Accessory protein regulator A n=1 Tax=Gottschalkia purinilytica TaxID=1503 RepID=A0A0L0WCK1_GOTPU|nr:LytTR family transcriptional regulator DNA-binding domain-containing protein [Gottschalkia purinilytica]KNF09140.1 accessory protein regulator A [Gottschalkia purinilytica]